MRSALANGSLYGIKMKLILKLSAPYLAVAVFWCIHPNAWLAILAYHAQVLFWSHNSFAKVSMPKPTRIVFMALPAAIAGPLFYILLPYITHTELSTWLEHYHLSPLSLILMIPYFGIVHPCLEQMHWNELRKATHLSHPLFAGYHMIVLSTLLTLPWLVVCFGVLTISSFLWKQMEQKSESLGLAVISHVLADFGIILTAYIVM